MGQHTLVLRSNGTVTAYGLYDRPALLPTPPLTQVSAIAAGGNLSFALRTDGTVWIWDFVGTPFGAWAPMSGLTGVKAIAAGPQHLLALKTNGTVATWGDPAGGAGTVPAGINGVSGRIIHGIAAGKNISAIHFSDAANFRAVQSWGAITGVRSQPGGYASVSAGFGHLTALRRDGTLDSWGDAAASAVPAGLSGVRFISAGEGHTSVLKNDGSVTRAGAWYFPPPNCGIVGGIAANKWHTALLTGALFPALEVYSSGVRVSRSSITMADVAEPRVFTIVNEGHAPLTGLGVGLSQNGAHFSLTDTSVTTLAPGGSTTITLRYHPQAPGPHSATLSFQSNDPDDALIGLSISGVTGATPVRAWRMNHFFGLSTNTSAIANGADYDSDSVINMLEFAFGTDPKVRAEGLAPLRYTGPATGGGTLVARGQPAILYQKAGNTVTVRGLWMRRKDHVAAGLVYTPEFAANTNAFTPSATTPQVLASDAYYDVVAVTFPATVPGGVPKFFRVRVSIPNPD